MNDTIELGHPDVAAFVAQVRAHLADLSADEQQDLTEGLAADLGDQVAERGPEVLGDPAAYARELRQAAGLAPAGRRSRLARGLPDVGAMLDTVHAHWDTLLAGLPRNPSGFLESLRPVWWVARAWLAVQLVDLTVGSQPFGWIPSLLGGLGWLVTLAAVVVSVQLGRGRVWPAPVATAAWRRVLLLALNGFAVAILVPVVAELPTGTDVQDAYGSVGYVDPSLTYKGAPVQNIYPYDAQGNPLVGVQLVDGQGRRLGVSRYHDDVELVPWTNGRTRLFSVFPLPARTMDPETGEYAGTPTLTPPLASLPPVSLAGVTASTFAGAPTPVPSGP